MIGVIGLVFLTVVSFSEIVVCLGNVLVPFSTFPVVRVATVVVVAAAVVVGVTVAVAVVAVVAVAVDDLLVTIFTVVPNDAVAFVKLLFEIPVGSAVLFDKPFAIVPATNSTIFKEHITKESTIFVLHCNIFASTRKTTDLSQSHVVKSNWLETLSYFC